MSKNKYINTYTCIHTFVHSWVGGRDTNLRDGHKVEVVEYGHDDVIDEHTPHHDS